MAFEDGETDFSFRLLDFKRLVEAVRIGIILLVEGVLLPDQFVSCQTIKPITTGIIRHAFKYSLVTIELQRMLTIAQFHIKLIKSLTTLFSPRVLPNFLHANRFPLRLKMLQW